MQLLRLRTSRRATTLLTAICCLTACGTDADGPDASSGFYRLASINGTSLPYATGGPLKITRGELLLRSDGTFIEAIDGVGTLLEGLYSATSAEIRFRASSSGSGDSSNEFAGAVHGDSIVIGEEGTLRLVYRRSPLPDAPVRSARYLLSQVNGKGRPLTLGDTVIKGTRYVGRVDFDSITFVDGLFFKQHRRESAISYLTNGDSVVDSKDGRSYGSYFGDTDRLVLDRYYLPLVGQARADSLALGANSALTRRTRLRVGVLEETYSWAR